MTGLLVAVAAGWYPDSIQTDQVRWWDGSGWTEHTAMVDPAATAEIAVHAAADEPDGTMTRRELRNREVTSAAFYTSPIEIAPVEHRAVSKGTYVPMARNWGAAGAAAAIVPMQGRRRSRGVVISLAVLVLAVVAFVVLAMPQLLPNLMPAFATGSTALSSNSSVQSEQAISIEQRAAYLTEAGLETKIQLDFESSGSSVAETDCLPFATLDVGAQSTCAMQLDGKLVSFIVEVSPETSDTAFELVGLDEPVAP